MTALQQQKAGKAQKDISQQFEKEVSFAVTSTARMKYEDRRFRQALTYATQNIENQVATAEDYIIKANCILALRNDMQSNTQVIELINTAKSLDPTNINIYKAEILANLRLKDRNKASDLLNSYHSKLEEMRSQLNEIKSGVFWETTNRFINVEQEWSNRMRIKLQGM